MPSHCLFKSIRRFAITLGVLGIALLSLWFWHRTLVGGMEIELPDTPEEELGALGLLARWRLKSEPLEKNLIEAIQAKDLEAAEKWCRELTVAIPRSPESFYKLAAVLALRQQTEEALTALATAVELGFRDAHRLAQDGAWAELRADSRFTALLAECQSRPPLEIGVPAKPADIQDGAALVADHNTAFDPASGLFRTLFTAPRTKTENEKWTAAQDPGTELLEQWWSEGTAAGNRGDFYDNRDGGHSKMPRDDFPQLAFIEYGPEARVLNLQWGLPRGILHNGIVIGNASVAAVGDENWRSMSRAAVSTVFDLALLHTQFASNQLYVYPCHHDYRPGHNGEEGHGDVFFTNTPYTITSQGSSGSDQPFLRALTFTLAALRPDVKQFLAERHAISPTLQMIFRASNRRLTDEDDYFTGAAHPPVFRNEDIDQAKMLRLAHDLTVDNVPPIAALRVLSESEPPVLGRDVFEPQLEERLFDTPHVVARVFRGTAQRRQIVLSAEDSRDLNGRQLTWRWAVLCGDPQAIQIKPLNAASSQVELSVPWHDRRPVERGSTLETNRIDIGCFVHNGTYWSCPAFITFYCPDNEQRIYDSQGRIESITYNSNYADPAVVIRKDWRDEYHYNADGLTGWTRVRDESRQEFTANGQRILVPASDGKPAQTCPVLYQIRQKRRTRAVEQVDVLE